MTKPADAETHDAELSPRVLHKSNRAAELFGDFVGSVQEWNANHTFKAPARGRWEPGPEIELFHPPGLLETLPWEEWYSTFHDAVHNLRVALDSIVYEMAHIDGRPANPAKVAFPITEHPNAWANASSSIASIPASLLDRIRQCQPWARPDSGGPDPLSLVSQIDNHDKHRSGGVQFEAIALPAWGEPVEAMPAELASAEDEWSLESWMRFTFDSPPFPEWRGLVRVEVGPLAVFKDHKAPAVGATYWLHSEIKRMITFLLSGEWPEGEFIWDGPEPLWTPLV